MGSGRFSTIFLAIITLWFCAGCDFNSFPEDPESVLPSEINEDLTLIRSLSPYSLDGYAVVQPGITLTIEPGTQIIADHRTCDDDVVGSCAALIVSKGAYLIADGTPEEPIVFTTDNGRRGDWSGIVINGNAPCNTGEDSNAPALTGPYCGAEPADSSGVIRYVIIEHAGVVAVDSLNHYPAGLSLHGVGNKTLIDYVHVINSEYNGISLVGGTVDVRHALATCVGENGFGWHDGWQGRGQFWMALQCSERADSGIFGSNVPALESGLDLAPRSFPTVFNFTLLGPQQRDAGREGIELTLGTGARLVNGIVINHRQKGFWINDRESCVYIEDGSITLKNVYFASNERDFTDRCGENALFLNEVEGNAIGTTNILVDPYNEMAPNYMLNEEGAAFPRDPSAGALEWFEPADYIGAVGGEDWTLPLRAMGQDMP